VILQLPVCFLALSANPARSWSRVQKGCLAWVHRWRDEVIRAGRKITRIALAFEAGRDGFWLARWLRAHGVEAHVIHPFEAENVHLRLGQAPGHRRTRGTGANDQDVNRGGHANESLAMRGRSINGVSEGDCQRRTAMLLLSVVTSELAYGRPAFFFGMR
jgi:hypothetical protein